MKICKKCDAIVATRREANCCRYPDECGGCGAKLRDQSGTFLDETVLREIENPKPALVLKTGDGVGALRIVAYWDTEDDRPAWELEELRGRDSLGVEQWHSVAHPSPAARQTVNKLVATLLRAYSCELPGWAGALIEP